MISLAKRLSARPVGHLTQLLPEVRVLGPTAPGTRIARGALFPNRRSPEDARWDAERQAVEFGVEMGECTW